MCVVTQNIKMDVFQRTLLQRILVAKLLKIALVATNIAQTSVVSFALLVLWSLDIKNIRILWWYDQWQDCYKTLEDFLIFPGFHPEKGGQGARDSGRKQLLAPLMQGIVSNHIFQPHHCGLLNKYKL